MWPQVASWKLPFDSFRNNASIRCIDLDMEVGVRRVHFWQWVVLLQRRKKHGPEPGSWSWSKQKVVGLYGPHPSSSPYLQGQWPACPPACTTICQNLHFNRLNFSPNFSPCLLHIPCSSYCWRGPYVLMMPNAQSHNDAKDANTAQP